MQSDMPGPTEVVKPDDPADELRAHLGERAAELGLDAARLAVEYIFNWGGFVNRSYNVSDGRVALHAKLTPYPDIKEGLRRWRELHALLEERYHAPRMIGWVELPASGYEGPIFEHIAGVMPIGVSAELAARVLPTLRRLHADDELRARLPAAREPVSCAERYRQGLHEAIADSQRIAESARLPFVGDARLAWMRDEAARIERIVRRSPAFREPGDSPIHADLWSNNILLTADDRWYLLDWDDLSVGDPALDIAMLLTSPTADGRAPYEHALPDELDVDNAFRERMALYRRAELLYWTVDGLADYVDADSVPGRANAVRAEKQAVFERLLALYLASYG